MAYSAASVWISEVDLTHYLNRNNTPAKWLDPSMLWYCTRPVLPLTMCLLLTPPARRVWLWRAFGLIAAFSLFQLWDSARRPEALSWSLGIPIVLLPFATWPLTAMALGLAWRDRIMHLVKAPFR